MKTLFIDFGNVIGFFDHQRAITQLAPYTILSPVELTLQLYGGALESDYEIGRYSSQEFTRLALQHGQLSCTPEQFLAAFVDIFWRNDDVCRLIPILAQTHRLVVASNTNDAHFMKYCEQFADVLQHFTALCPSHQIGARKPHPKYFKRCQQVAQVQPADCLFIDDLAVNVEAARDHGWDAVLYRPDGSLLEELRARGVQFPADFR